MNSKPVDTVGSGEHLTLPEPDPDNITVLTRNLPNTPILPWNHYDSPWSDPEAETTEPEADISDLDTQNLEQNAETLEEAAQAEAITPEVLELDSELDMAQITSEVTADTELDMAQITSEVTADAELDTAQITSEVTADADLNDQRLIALLDPPEETPTDELTG